MNKSISLFCSDDSSCIQSFVRLFESCLQLAVGNPEGKLLTKDFHKVSPVHTHFNT